MAMQPRQETLGTPEFKQAVALIQKRAERQIDIEKLTKIFVQSDIFVRTLSNDNQLILGRRGTGKTHMIRFFAQHQVLIGDVVNYIDCTKLGSGYQSIPGMTASDMATKYFSAFLNELCTDLLDSVIRMENPNEEKQNHLFSLLTNVADFLAYDAAAQQSHFNYRQITDTIEAVLDGLGVSRLFVLLDEWAQIPNAVQPHFAEFLKRSIFPIPRISTKILAVNYQCEFSERVGDGYVGIQRGADLADVLDVDSYLIYDEKRDQVVSFFGQVLYNHLGVELGWDLAKPPEEKLNEIDRLFTQKPAFIQLVRAAEGNCRDFLCIFGRAYFDGFLTRSGGKGISISNVEQAAGSWFEQEKVSNVKIEGPVITALTRIYEEVIKGYKSRTFLVHSSLSEHPTLMRLLNERVLHKLNITYSHRDKPGERYELFTLDYGAYVKFKGTENEPQEQIFFEPHQVQELAELEKRQIVPVDDHRSIRRIVLDPRSLEGAY